MTKIVDEVGDEEGVNDTAADAKNQEERGHHTGNARILRFNDAGSVHHSQRAKISAGDRHQNSEEDEDPFVFDVNRP